jgi:hypothetical protein
VSHEPTRTHSIGYGIVTLVSFVLPTPTNHAAFHRARKP